MRPAKACLPRHTGEVARRGGGGELQSRCLLISDLKFSRSFASPSPSAPSGHLPRMTGEAKRGQAAPLTFLLILSTREVIRSSSAVARVSALLVALRRA